MADPEAPEAATATAAAARPPLRDLLAYFVRLGSFGFGGPIALCGYMQRDLVERRGWVTAADYREGLALAQLAPGPLAAQLAIYIGWLRAGVLGATLTALAFVLPSFLMVLGISAAYVGYGGLPWMQKAFYGVGAAVIAIVARSALKLTKLSLGRDRALWAVFAVNAVVTAVTESEIVWVVLSSGAAIVALRSSATSVGAVAVPIAAFGLEAAAHGRSPIDIALYFAKAGAFVFGSGLAIIPYLHGGVVDQFRWIDDRQFLDAVAIAMITPGPVVITTAFIGYLVAGPGGAAAAAFGVFLPCYLFVIVPAPYFRRIAGEPRVKAFVDGVTAAATGAIAGATIVLARRSISDFGSAAVLVATFISILELKKAPEPLVIVAAGAVGWSIRTLAG